ncbi:hypothetical protein K466DRAFT_606734 [Polyporus arcularius HHB13444]|uniref:Uncharacterized protein n=2 Tax=Polyporaceae TaxID=5317 RepID=A0A5C3NRW9_9APHY|nr:hypothetical protein OH76DRAFT_1477186 [Polyporus brumalis]TFK78700.1 hypothetical protein K466DRAFT_606734 [Polyporus arcularius HHB13444]
MADSNTPSSQSDLNIVYYRPPATPGQPAPPLRPASRWWLENGGTLDGALRVPQYYYDDEEMRQCLTAARAAASLLELHHGRAAARAVDNHRPSPDPVEIPAPAPASQEVPAPPAATPAASQRSVDTTSVPDEDSQPHAVSVAPHAEEYLVSVTMHYTEHIRGPVSRGSKVVPKMVQLTKMVHIALRGLTRANFVREFLDVHSLADQFAAGPLSGPTFKIWWTGINKGDAFTVENDTEFGTAISAILKKRGCNRVGVEFKQVDLNGFHSRSKRPRPFETHVPSDGDEEVLSGTQVPNVNQYPDQTQLHGAHILELQRLHKCKDHVNEQNAPGYCYKPEAGGLDDHVRLNNHRFKIWAAAIASGDASKWQPPNHASFDAVRSRPRGQAGPHAPAAAAQPQAPADALQAMLLGLLPLLGMFAGQQFAALTPASAPLPYSLGNPPRTPASVARMTPPTSPLPPPADELHQFLIALSIKKDVDMLDCEAELAAREFTPDILPSVAFAQLKEATGVADGKIVKMQVFAKEWVARQQEKRKARSS